MFAKATRLKLRFDSPKGLLTTEDLWTLPLSGGAVNLDDMAINVNRRLKDTDTMSFVNDVKEDTEHLQLKFDILKHIIDVKLAERDQAANASKLSAQEQQIMAILKTRENEALLNMSTDELQQQLNELRAEQQQQ